MSSDSSPPLPKPIKYAHFEFAKNGIHTAAGYDRDRIENARKQALEWINENPHLDIITIDSSFGQMLAIVTVWYR